MTLDLEALVTAFQLSAQTNTALRTTNAALTIERNHAVRQYAAVLEENLELRRKLDEAQRREVERLAEDNAELRRDLDVLAGAA